MKLILSAFISFILFLNNCSAQSGWQLIDPGYSQTYNSVYFTDSLTGMACGNSGVVVKTTNAGMNWTNLNTGTSYNLNTVRMFSPAIAVAAGDNQIIIRTTDGGVSWNILNGPSPLNYSIIDLNIFGTGQALANSVTWVSPSYNICLYKTTNSGAIWQIQPISSLTAEYVWFTDFNNGWGNGSYSTGPPLNQYYLRVYRTTNGGSSWSVINQGSGVSINPGKIYFYNLSLGFKYSHIGSVYFNRSVDGGYNWGTGGASLTSQIRCYYFINSLTGWIVGDNSLLKKTENSGSSWTDQTPPVSANLKSVWFLNSQTGWIAADNSGLFKTITGGVTSVNNISNETAIGFALYQNYPNPFNPLTKIRFAVPKNGFVKLVVFDVLGREVETLVNEKQTAGIYDVNWNASQYSGGVYFYKLISNDITETKKMLLLK